MSRPLTQRAARRMARRLLSHVRGGQLEVREGGSRHVYGDATGGLNASVEVRDPRAWSALLRGSTGYAEGFVNGWWDTDDPVALVRLTARSMAPLDRHRARWQPVIGPLLKIASLVPQNTLTGARENIAAHYDLGNELFSSFLDPQMIYSSAVFERPGMTLEEAQRAKLDRLCGSLRLGPADHLIEIGSGWGGMAVHAAREYGCRVTTTTISREQREWAERSVVRAGLEDRIKVLGADYRDLRGRYTKLVSIEMIEAVGWQYFPAFFRKCSDLLTDDGLMSIQAIVISDELYELEKASRSFANTHIFPGGCLPSERLIHDETRERTDMRHVRTDDITADYAHTLRIWRERFNAARPRLEPLGYDDRFRRLWNFYLAFSEAGFRERRIRDLQMTFAKPCARLEVASSPARSRTPAVPA